MLVIGLDADARSMAEASRRAARAKGGRAANAAFVVAAAEAIPSELRGLGALVTVRFPWASLLRGCLGLDDAVASGVAGLLAPGGALELLLAPAGRDRLAGLPTEPAGVIEAARATFECRDLAMLEGRLAAPGEVRASGSTWARRLLGGRGSVDEGGRRAVIVRFRAP